MMLRNFIVGSYVRHDTIGCFFRTSFPSFHFVAQSRVISVSKGLFHAVIDIRMQIILVKLFSIDQQLFL